MPSYIIGNFFVYTLINAFTPGPGNILAMKTAVNCGWKRGRPLFLGIFAGYYVVQFLCAVFIFGISAALPQVLGVIKYVGAAYILWLAVHIALSHPTDSGVDQRTSFLKGFLLQFVNIKIYLFGITALTGYVTPYSTKLWVLLLFEAIIATIGSAATLSWIGAGTLIQQFYVKHSRTVNSLLALALLECVVSILTV